MSMIQYDKKKSYILLLGLLVIFISGCGPQESVQILKIGDSAPSFVLLDIQGKKASLSDYKGKVIIVDFWATYCPPCKKSIPFLNELQRTYEEKGFTVLGLSMDGSTKTVISFKENIAIDYPVLMGNSDVARQYNVRGLPTIFVLDRQGRIVHKTLYVTDAEKKRLKNLIEQSLQSSNNDV